MPTWIVDYECFKVIFSCIEILKLKITFILHEITWVLTLFSWWKFGISIGTDKLGKIFGQNVWLFSILISRRRRAHRLQRRTCRWRRRQPCYNGMINQLKWRRTKMSFSLQITSLQAKWKGKVRIRKYFALTLVQRWGNRNCSPQSSWTFWSPIQRKLSKSALNIPGVGQGDNV